MVGAGHADAVVQCRKGMIEYLPAYLHLLRETRGLESANEQR